jgi:hypothetical protein
LSLNFLCGLAKWLDQIIGALAGGKVTLDDLRDIAQRNKWSRPNSEWCDRAVVATQAPDEVAAVGFHTYNLFHEVHSELRQFGKWAVETLEAYAASLDGAACIADRMTYPGAPDPKWCEFLPDHLKANEKSVTVRCGLWAPTVCWRGLKVRKVKRYDRIEPCMSMLHEKRGFRAISPQVLIENVSQSLSRNQISELKLRMWKNHGFDTSWDIYDQALFHTPELRRCYEALMREAGPGGLGNGCGYGNYFVLHPNEVEYHDTMLGEAHDAAWWLSQP